MSLATDLKKISAESKNKQPDLQPIWVDENYNKIKQLLREQASKGETSVKLPRLIVATNAVIERLKEEGLNVEKNNMVTHGCTISWED